MSDDLISRQAVLDILRYECSDAVEKYLGEKIESLPSIDIVRCEECKYGQADLFHMFCAYHHHKTYADDFCNYGERSE